MPLFIGVFDAHSHSGFAIVADIPNPGMQKLLNFQSMIFGGTGETYGTDVRGQLFDDRYKSGEFSKSGLQEVAKILVANIMRLRAHKHLPMSIFNYGRRFQEVYAKFINEPARYTVEGVSEEQVREFQANERTWQWMMGNDQHFSAIGGVTSGDHVAGFASVPEPGSWFEEHKRKQIDAFGGSLVIEAWTMFESLSEDLWEAALNFHPTILANLGGKAKLSFNDLQLTKFNVRDKMGTLLKRSQTVGFRSLKDIRESYRLAFSEQFAPIEDVLDDKLLRYASAVRNLLIHKRGIMDKEFAEQTAGIPDVPVFDPNGPPVAFQLTGEICGTLTDACEMRSRWLVNAVHGWIIGHPESLPNQLGNGDSGEPTR